jgi:glucose-6-phosphate isomerase
MTAPTALAEWQALQRHRQDFTATLQQLYEQRRQPLGFACEGLTLDLSHCHLTPETLALLLDLAKAAEVEAWRGRMVRGEKINTTEHRAVLHMALRGSLPDDAHVDDVAVTPAIQALQQQMAKFVADIREGRWLGATGKPIRHIVNLGIGGSDLGPRLVVKALKHYASGPKVHFVANADAADLLDVLELLDPAETLFVVVSKTFSTQETLLNARSARQWLVRALGEAAVSRHFVAVSTNHAAMAEFGINPDNAFGLWDWVGGRFSLWSSVGLAIALAIGWDKFLQLLHGAAAMDRHFLTAPHNSNLPVLLAMIGIWYRNFWDSQAEAVLPYSERLRELPRYLQQLQMESNGKCVRRDGSPVDYPTMPAVFGECGTIGQHSFHQWLHQGTDLVLAEFIGVRQDGEGAPEHHQVLRANLQAQAEALALGSDHADPHRCNPGNRPSLTLWLDRLDPYHLGLLLALYEHKVFVQGVVWDINSFDQFGVELGKRLAQQKL